MICACEKTVVFVMHATGVYSVYTLLLELSVLRSGNPKLCYPQCCIWFPGSSVHRIVFAKMILLLVGLALSLCHHQSCSSVFMHIAFSMNSAGSVS